ncbi:helix-turn-helix transcriptional regulator [Streptomyces sp. SCA3-4]|uniref:helix-turn-helix domain-containing protein n=1 Tax=Streptomyces sichuanensis TaxID=2871810 RepID=UPI001CE352D4|nr:helix-turn-helix transcriptional regulator [Streptomyces sichuanensis]MCA6093212.1 helix-turn-helix transcriptional regulator [Streptomyces sichuanensis]
MPPRTSPTERQKRLGYELHKMRQAAGVTAEAVASLLGVDRSKISNIEKGVRTLSPDRLRSWAYQCACSDTAYVEALVEMAKPPGRGWWERFRGVLPGGLLDIAELEAHATRLRTAHTVHIPGLLQTVDHARSIFDAVVPPLPQHERELRLVHRLERQRILTQEKPPEYAGIIHEAALRMQFGGRAVARAQLEHLVTMSELSHVNLRVLPVANGVFPGAGQTLVYAEAAVPQLDTVQIDSTHGPEFLAGEAQLAKYRAQLEWMDRLTLAPGESLHFIQEIARQL